MGSNYHVKFIESESLETINSKVNELLGLISDDLIDVHINAFSDSSSNGRGRYIVTIVYKGNEIQ